MTDPTFSTVIRTLVEEVTAAIRVEFTKAIQTTPQIQPNSLPDFEVESRLRKPSRERGSAPRPGDDSAATSLSEALEQYERELIRAALQRCGGNLSRAAQQLDLSRHALRYRMSRLNLAADGVVDDDAESSSVSAPR